MPLRLWWTVDSTCKRRLREGSACLRSDRRCGRRSFLESSATAKAHAQHAARRSTGANTVEGGTVGDAAAQPTLPTGTDFSLGVSLSFCGGSVRKETSVGCAQLNRSDGSDWRALWVLPLRTTQSGYCGDASLSRLRLSYRIERDSTD